MKRMICGMLMALLAVSAFAKNSSYLYWTVDFDDRYENEGDFLAKPSVPGTYDVWLLADLNGTRQYFHTDADRIVIGEGPANIGGAVATDLSSLSTLEDCLFFVQIGQISGSDYADVWSTASWSYDALAPFVQSDALSPVGNVWNAAVTPEPTGALLLLLGVAGLALRRKRT